MKRRAWPAEAALGRARGRLRRVAAVGLLGAAAAMACSTTSAPRGRTAAQPDPIPEGVVRALRPTTAVLPSARLRSLLELATRSPSASRPEARPDAPADPLPPASTTSADSEPALTAADCPATIDALEGARDVPLPEEDATRLRGPVVLVAAKGARRLLLYRDGALHGCWRTALGFDPVGHKQREGDGRTPLGWYGTSDKPWSTFDDAIAIHYPNAADAEEGLSRGVIGRRQRDKIRAATDEGKLPPQRTALGGALLIHGGGSSSDWTLGCIALEDGDLVELRAALPSDMRADLLIVP